MADLPVSGREQAALAEAMPSSAKAYEQLAPPVQPIAAGTPYGVPTAKSASTRSPRSVCFLAEQSYVSAYAG